MKRLILTCFVFVLMVMLPMINLKADNNLELIYRSFVGEKSNYQGFIEIWNIDTFEGGNVGKYDILQSVAKEYQKENKGTYVIVRNVSESECVNMLARGQFPDLFSCSYGVASEIKEYVVPFDKSFDELYSNLLDAGNFDGEQYAIAWCYGSYYMFSTRTKIEKYFNENDKVSLSQIALSTGYEKNNKNKKQIIYSLGFGQGKYLLPQIAFSSYTGREIALDKYALNVDAVKNNTPYDAYCDFLTGECNILIGTQRDLIKLRNREVLGKIDELVVESVGGFTDLVQYMLITNNSKQRYEYAQRFVQKLTEKKTQQKILESGLFSVDKNIKYEQNNGIMSNITLENISSYTIHNVFLSKIKIEQLQKI